ncbi:MAG: PD-(D/E)XK nuclease family protein [Clostridia bacterium]|nr:PD-(D/E)XK nuclease family protein [Clostridia bacterium]
MMFRFNGVSERDMDLLFLEEFAVNKDFRDLFIQQIQDFDLNGHEIVSEELSFVDAALGESDLTIVLENKGHKVALLIEDKINAVAQPRQYERYVERGNKGILEKAYDKFYVFLIAPAGYFKGNDSAEKYPLKVTYEECQGLFATCADVRSELKLQQITEAIEQGHKPYTKIVDVTSTSFWDSYVRYMQIHYPDIELKSKVREKSKNGDWPTYKTSLDMKTVYIHHKMKMKGVEYSNIDLTFNGLADYREELKTLLKDMLGDRYDPQFGIHKAGKSAVLRLVAPKCLDWQVPFEEQKDVVDEHLHLVSKLCEAAKMIDKERLVGFYTDVVAR